MNSFEAVVESETTVPPGFLVFDTESVPDGRLLARVKFPGQDVDAHEAIQRVQQERLATKGSDFIPVTFQYPVALCVLRVGIDYRLQAISCLDAPQFRSRHIVEDFWKGVRHYHEQYTNLQLVTFNGRGFDLPLLETAAFRYGVCGGDHFVHGRKRFGGWQLDLMDWFTNYGAFRLNGGLDLLCKLLGKPGKMEVKGGDIYGMHRAGRIQEINDYCMRDTLDTYFVLLRTRVMTGALSSRQEQELVRDAKNWIAEKSGHPTLADYLADWGDWEPSV